MKIRIGTRGSRLALWQAYYVADRLSAAGVDSEIVTIETRGDKQLDVAIAKIGSKGVFTEEIEAQLQEGAIDIAVHSAKDMQSHLPEGFSLIAYGEREEVHDVLVSHHRSMSMEPQNGTGEPMVLGTSSTRRKALLKHFFPHIQTVDVRGNLQTRIGKMENGHCHALLLAYAGVHRMDYGEMIVHRLPLDKFIPPVGQGSIAVEAGDQLDKTKLEAIRRHVNHEPSEKRLLAERAFLRRLRGGCSIPVFALAELQGQDMRIRGGIVSLDGQELIVKEYTGPVAQAEDLGLRLAESVLEAGGNRILQQIRNELPNNNP